MWERSVFGLMILDLRHLCPERKVVLRSTLRNLRCSKISIGRMFAEEPWVLSKLGGYYVLLRKGFGTQGSAEVVIDVH